MHLLKGKKGLVMGVANERSIAWGIANEAFLQGADLCLTYQNNIFKERILKLANSINCQFTLECDVENKKDISKLFLNLKKKWGKIDFIVHALAFSDKNELKGNYFDTSKYNFRKTLIVSSFSFTEVCKEAKGLMSESGGSILTLTYIGGERTTPNYNVMGVAKAALEASVRYLSVDLGKNNIRVNSLSSGPMKTLAGSAITGARHIFKHSEKNSPLTKNPSLKEISTSAVYLLSDLSSGVTGENHFVDGGYNIVAIPKE
ncbi:MAG: enoyl-ACP reductase [Candidatus Puniceispirillales bacterium]